MASVTTTDQPAADIPGAASQDVFGDLFKGIELAVRAAVADQRKRGLLIPVDRGSGVELIP